MKNSNDLDPTSARDEIAQHFVKKTVSLGKYSEGKEYLKVIEEHNITQTYINVDEDSKVFLETTTFDTKQSNITLVFVPASGLGFSETEITHGCSFEDIRLAGLARGLQMCPPDTGPTLRLEYLDQVTNSRANPLANILIAMEPVSTNTGAPFIFSVYADSNEGVLVLSAETIASPKLFSDAPRFAFVLPE